MIDVHHHMFPSALTAALSEVGIERIGGEPVAGSWAPERSLELMDRYGIGAAVLSVPVPLPFADAIRSMRLARELNEFGGDVARRFPGRFGFFATLPLPDIQAAVGELRFALDELGADGIALLTNHAGIYPGDRRLDSLYAELDARAAVVFVHPTVPSWPGLRTECEGSPVPGIQPSLLEFPFDTTRAVASLVVSNVLERFPRVRHVFTHSGGCVSSVAGRLIDRKPLIAAYAATAEEGSSSSLERLEQLVDDAQHDAADELATLHYDVALSSDAHALSGITRLVPIDRLLLGTDYPMAREIGLHLTLRGLARIPGFTAAERAAIRSSNAARLFPRLRGAARRDVDDSSRPGR
jgi:predicted TIM-barrel fold metal-dependent hydrolase